MSRSYRTSRIPRHGAKLLSLRDGKATRSQTAPPGPTGRPLPPGDRVAGRHAEQLTLDQPASSDGAENTQRQAHDQNESSLPHEQPREPCGISTECEPNRDLALPVSHGVGD